MFSLWNWHKTGNLPLTLLAYRWRPPYLKQCSAQSFPGQDSVHERRGEQVWRGKDTCPLQPGSVPGKTGLLMEKPELQPPRDLCAECGKQGLQSLWLEDRAADKVSQQCQSRIWKGEPRDVCTGAKEGIILNTLSSSTACEISKLSRICFWELCNEMQMEEMAVNNPYVPQLKLCRTWEVSGRLCAVLVPKEDMEETEASFANWYLLI